MLCVCEPDDDDTTMTPPPPLPHTHTVYSTLFADGMLALQVVLIGMGVGFGVCYVCNAGYRVLQIHREVNKYIAISKPPPPTATTNYATNIQATATVNQSPTSMTMPRYVFLPASRLVAWCGVALVYRFP